MLTWFFHYGQNVHGEKCRSRGEGGGWKGVFDASPETAKRLIELGRRDAELKFKKEGLWGK